MQGAPPAQQEPDTAEVIEAPAGQGDDQPRYVMVPVPRQFVLEVLRWILFRAPGERTDGTGRDAARMVELVEEAHAAERALLLRVARATIRDEALRLDDAAEELGQSAQDIGAMVRRINQRALGGGRNLMRIRSDPGVGVRGVPGRTSYLEMRPDFARAVRDAAKAPD
jgi:hypothetical protein